MGNTEIHFRSWTYVPSLIEVLRVGICCCDRFSSVTAGLVEKLGIPIGSAISASRFSQGLGWLVAIFLGFYYVLILTAVFLLAIQGIGLAHSFADKRIEAWQGRLRESTKSGETNPRFHAGRILRLANRLFRNALVIVLLCSASESDSLSFLAPR